MRDLVLWTELPFKGPSQSMRMALVKLPDGDASKPHAKDENGFYPDESPRSRYNWIDYMICMEPSRTKLMTRQIR